MGSRISEIVTPSEFISLKNRIKNEVRRRKYEGDVSSFSNSQYDYIVAPKQNESILSEHISKIGDCVRAINDTNVNRVSEKSGDLMTEIVVFDAEITRFEKDTLTGGQGSCKSSCTGMCSSSCTGTCSIGCTGCTSCTGSCTDACTGSCSGNCSGCSGCSGCGGACSSSCGDWCSQTCGSPSCSGACSTSSSSSCGSACSSSCSGGGR